jgi:cytidine deaminase
MKQSSDEALRALIEAARKVSENAYCPYSRFRVGAAVLTDQGEIFSGCNVENASFGLTICAERNAIFQARAKGKVDIRILVVYTPTPKPAPPCGCCRQVISELAPEAEVICVCDGPEVLRRKIVELLPEAFGAQIRAR